MFNGNDSTNQGLQHNIKSSNSSLPIARSKGAIYGQIVAISPNRQPQIRTSSQQFHGVWSTGDYSSGEEVHLTKISSKMDGPITDDKDSGDRAVKKLKLDGSTDKETFSMDEEVHLTNISIYPFSSRTNPKTKKSGKFR
ncbi:hypothetical protein H5410_027629 [Solanum commersonii]|uniref:Uncharacterized protein n=1 Tax=Solanum commersonii TaxID=4109 RepID=A0A9J5YZQ5_SOLCO|nr:hypothetical protein H5410_027629 [Solanum commersonii]